MFDVTAGRSAGSPLNPKLDPTRPRDARDSHRSLVQAVVDVMAGRSAGTVWNMAQDPTRPVSPDDPRR
jgi:hypothetical protein